MNSKSRRNVAIALALSLAATVPLESALAANNDGALAGNSARPTAGPRRRRDHGAQSGDRLHAHGHADAQGNYRFPYLPVGKYQLEATRDGAEIGKLGEVTVNVGNATNVERRRWWAQRSTRSRWSARA